MLLNGLTMLAYHGLGLSHLLADNSLNQLAISFREGPHLLTSCLNSLLHVMPLQLGFTGFTSRSVCTARFQVVQVPGSGMFDQLACAAEMVSWGSLQALQRDTQDGKAHVTAAA
jgi:hypothetical protein